ncbi:MAG: hypothetical protein IPI12_00280 [Ignavibacteriales bacterium]|nr:hypothetical protein [Ignavibacteriales bacterium]
MKNPKYIGIKVFSLNLEKRKSNRKQLKKEEEARKKERADKGFIELDKDGKIVKESLVVEDPLLEEVVIFLQNMIEMIDVDKKAGKK